MKAGWTFVVLTSAERTAIIATAPKGFDFDESAIRLTDGRYKVPMQLSTVERITQFQHAGESLGETIMRICATHRGALN